MWQILHQFWHFSAETKLAADSLKKLSSVFNWLGYPSGYLQISIGFFIIYIVYVLAMSYVFVTKKILGIGLRIICSTMVCHIIITLRNELKVFHRQINSIVNINLNWPRIFKKLIGGEREENRNEEEERVRDE